MIFIGSLFVTAHSSADDLWKDFEPPKNQALTREVEPVVHEEDADDSPAVKKSSKRSSRGTVSNHGTTEEGPGIQGRVGYLAFKTFGRDDSIAPLELFPYIMADEHMVFGDLRGFVSDDGLFGGNAGVGYRYWLDSLTRAIGASFWYDADDTTGDLFHQLGLSLETYGQDWDFRTNLYFPIGDDIKEFHGQLVNPVFSGHSFLVNPRHETAEAMEGIDLEFGLHLPTEFLQTHDVRVYAGWYHFIGDAVPDIDGVRARIEGHVTPNIAAQVEFTDDDTFGTNVMLGVAFEFYGGKRGGGLPDSVQSKLMRRFVQRNYNVIVSRTKRDLTQLAAINPVTGQPYVFQHVSSSSSGGSGTIDNPYATIAEAQAAGGDIIFVHSGSVLSEAVTLQDGDQVFGDAAGLVHRINVDGGGKVTLPHVGVSPDRPTILGTSGNGVTLASNSFLDGFLIDSPSGMGIVGNGIANATVARTNIVDATGSGISLENLTGPVRFETVEIANQSDTALSISGGMGDVFFSGAIENSGGRALVVTDTSGSIDLSQATIDDIGGQGILLANLSGDIKLSDVTIKNSSLTGIDIQGGTGNYLFDGLTIVETAANSGLRVEDVAGEVQFDELRVSGAAGQHALELFNNGGPIEVTTLKAISNTATALFALDSELLTITNGTIDGNDGAAVDAENTTLNVNLTWLDSSNAMYGIRIVDSPGTFIVRGNNDYGTGGTITNTETGVLLDHAGVVGLQFIDFESNGVGVKATDTSELFVSRGRFINSTHYGIDSLNTGRLQVAASGFANNGEADENSVRATVDSVAKYQYEFLNNHFIDGSSTSIDIVTTGAGDGAELVLAFQGNIVQNSRAGDSGLRVDWTGPLLAEVSNNQFFGTGGSNVGVDVIAGSSTALADITVAQNEFTYDNVQSTGARFMMQAPSNLDITWNDIVFNSMNGTGFEFQLEKSANIQLAANAVVDNAGGGTGILFTSVDAASNVVVNDNLIQLLSSNPAIDRGIFFSSVSQTVNLSGTLDNLIQNASIPFYVPLGTAAGSVFINGAPVP